MNWRDIDGWFTDEDVEVYRRIVQSLPMRGGSVAEIGVWFGRSLGALIEQCRIQRRSPRIIAIDTFAGSDNDENLMRVVAQHGGSVFKQFMQNMEAIGYYRKLHPCINNSIDEAEAIEDQSLNAVFIDAHHAYDHVAADIRAWIPKIKQGGIIAGHDIDTPDVKRAVMEAFTGYAVVGTRCWLVQL
jgi:MMP 1-O-methyltransferase